MEKHGTPRPFTTTFPVAVLRELDEVAKETGLGKSEILVQAFMEWNAERDNTH